MDFWLTSSLYESYPDGSDNIQELIRAANKRYPNISLETIKALATDYKNVNFIVDHYDVVEFFDFDIKYKFQEYVFEKYILTDTYFSSNVLFKYDSMRNLIREYTEHKDYLKYIEHVEHVEVVHSKKVQKTYDTPFQRYLKKVENENNNCFFYRKKN